MAITLRPETIQAIIDQAASDPDFIRDFVNDPEFAGEARGIELNDAELAEIQSLVQTASELSPGQIEELEARISHSLLGHGEMGDVLLIENFLRSAAREE